MERPVWYRRASLWVQRFMRLHPERLFERGLTYSDACVSQEELRRTFDLPTTDAATYEPWFAGLGIAPLEALESELAQVTAASLRGGSRVELALEELKVGFGLDDLEVALLLAASAPRLSEGLSRAYSVAWSDFSLRQPTVGFLCALVSGAQPDHEARQRLQHHSPLLRHGLLTLLPHPLWQPHSPHIHKIVAVCDRVLMFMERDELPPPRGFSFHPSPKKLSSLVFERKWRQALERGLRRPRARLCLCGDAGSGRRTVLRAFADSAGRKLLEVEPDALASNPSWLQDAMREGVLQRADLLINTDEHNAPLETLLRHEPERLKTFPGAFFLVCQQPPASVLEAAEHWMVLHVDNQHPTLQRQLWQRTLSAEFAPEAAAQLAMQLSKTSVVTPRAMHRVLGAWKQKTNTEEVHSQDTATALLTLVEGSAGHGLGELTDRVSRYVGLKDLVLPEHTFEQLSALLLHAKHNQTIFDIWGFGQRSPGGKSVCALFSGPPGTGKSLAAGALAHALGRTLYRVDLSRIVDKYVGETEKNLFKVFDSASQSRAVLLFDEADSLFAKRTDVKSSNDRYANLEVNYLLQRLEDFEGLAVLTTNLPGSIDDAFRRRLRFQIEFEPPDAHLRSQLWKQLLPPDAPIDKGINFEALGESFVLSGGHIRNAILHTAILAADRGQPMCEDSLREGAIEQIRALGHLVPNKPNKPRRSHG